jgi:hypothetical protein
MNSSKRALSKRELDSSMYANILWTILATLIIYVVFVVSLIFKVVVTT